MNLFYKNYVHGTAYVLLFLAVGLLFQGCSKDKESEIITDGGTPFNGKILVNVLGTTEDDDIPSVNVKTASVATKSGSKRSSAVQPKVLKFEGFDAMVSVERDVLKKTNVTVGNVVKGKSSTGELSAAAVAVGVKYRLMLYKKDGTFVSSTLLTSGTPGLIDVVKGDAYDWYAISYNNTDDVPDVTNRVTPTLALPGGKDVLYASGEISIPQNGVDGNRPLGITFKHSLARVAVELNTMGMFANMVSAGVSVSGIAAKTGTINLKTGALTNLTNYTQTIDYTNFTDVNSLYQDAKVAYIYTADVAPLSNLTVTVNDLTIRLDNNTNRAFGPLLTATPSVFTFNITPQLGRSYRALVNLIESPLTLAGVRWARTNIYFQGGHNPYRFNHTYTPTTNANSYFAYRALTPANTAKGDPCAVVYPAGIWRQATFEDFNALTRIGGPAYTYGTEGGSGYMEYRTSIGTATPYPGKDLRFVMNGEANTVRLLSGVVELQFSNTTTRSEVWTSSPLLGLGAINVGAYFYSGASFADNTANSLLNVDLVGLNVAGVNLKNVRCVRTTLPTPN